MTVKDIAEYCVYQIMDQYDRRSAEQIVNIILEDAFGITNAKSEKTLSDKDITIMKALIAKVSAGEPVQYVTGKVNFMGIMLDINKHVLIPRPETEELVSWIIEDHKDDGRQFDILDIGTGSGCIALALKHFKPSLRVFALEESIDALNVARLNAKLKRLSLDIFRIDFLDESQWPYLGMFDIIVSNPPYIPLAQKNDMSLSVIDHEPSQALFVSDDDPLIFYRKISSFASQKLSENGHCYVEINEYLTQETLKLFHDDGWSRVELRQDLQGKDRMIKLSR